MKTYKREATAIPNCPHWLQLLISLQQPEIGGKCALHEGSRKGELAKPLHTKWAKTILVAAANVLTAATWGETASPEDIPLSALLLLPLFSQSFQMGILPE